MEVGITGEQVKHFRYVAKQLIADPQTTPLECGVLEEMMERVGYKKLEDAIARVKIKNLGNSIRPATPATARTFNTGRTEWSEVELDILQKKYCREGLSPQDITDALPHRSEEAIAVTIRKMRMRRPMGFGKSGRGGSCSPLALARRRAQERNRTQRSDEYEMTGD